MCVNTDIYFNVINKEMLQYCLIMCYIVKISKTILIEGLRNFNLKAPLGERLAFKGPCWS